MKIAHELTRAQLHELVWTDPMRTVAARFGISDVGLKKLVAKASIPVPPRGYWAKLRAGKKVSRVALPLREPGMDDEISILRGQSYWYSSQTEEEILAAIPDLPSWSESIDAVRERVRKRIGRVSVPRDLTKPHAVVTALMEKDGRRRRKENSPWYGVSHEPEFDDAIGRRRLRILNAIFLATSRAGAQPWVGSRETLETGVRVHQQFVRFDVTVVQQKRHGRKKSAASAGTEAKRLRFSISGGGPGEVKERIAWEDDESGRIERRMGEIAVEIVTTAEVQYRELCVSRHEWRVERKAQLEEVIREREAKAEWQRREKEAARAKERVERLLAHAENLRRATDIQAYVSSVCDTAGADPAVLEIWRVWALAEADRIDPIVSRSFLGLMNITSEEHEEIG